MQHPPFRRFLDLIRDNSEDFQSKGRILRCKQYMKPDANPAMIDEVISALSVNTRIEVLYIQNYERVRIYFQPYPVQFQNSFWDIFLSQFYLNEKPLRKLKSKLSFEIALLKNHERYTFRNGNMCTSQICLS